MILILIDNRCNQIEIMILLSLFLFPSSCQSFSNIRSRFFATTTTTATGYVVINHNHRQTLSSLLSFLNCKRQRRRRTVSSLVSVSLVSKSSSFFQFPTIKTTTCNTFQEWNGVKKIASSAAVSSRRSRSFGSASNDDNNQQHSIDTYSNSNNERIKDDDKTRTATSNDFNVISTEIQKCDVITSLKSNTVKKIQSLLIKRKKREEYQQTIVEGPRIILDLLRNTHTQLYIDQIIVSIDKYEYYYEQICSILQETTSLRKQQQQQQQHSISSSNNQQKPHSNEKTSCHILRIAPATNEVIQACSDTVTNQGILAICRIPSATGIDRTDPKQLDGTSTVSSSSSFLVYHRKEEGHNNSNNNNPVLHLVLDGIQDPGNIGTLIRSAVAAGGVQRIYFINGSCDPWNPKSIRSAMGSTFAAAAAAANNDGIVTRSGSSSRIQLITTIDTWSECYQHLINDAMVPMNQIYAATMMQVDKEEQKVDGRTKDIAQDATAATGNVKIVQDLAHYDVDWCGSSTGSSSSSSVLIIGNEGNGLCTDIRNDIRNGFIQPVHVPMNDDDNNTDCNDAVVSSSFVVESLNAAVCGSIILFEYSRQRRMKKQSNNKNNNKNKLVRKDQK